MISRKKVLYSVAFIAPITAIAVIGLKMDFTFDDGDFIRLFSEVIKSGLVLLGAGFISYATFRAARS